MFGVGGGADCQRRHNNTKVFLNNHFRTGTLAPDQITFGWGESESVDKEVIEEYFLGNNDALRNWADKRAHKVKDKINEDEQTIYSY